MEINKKELQSIITQAVESAIAELEKRHFIVDEKPKEKSAYAKTESLLYNYRGFQRVVEARMKEIEEIKQYGVPQKSKSIVEWGGSTGGTVPMRLWKAQCARYGLLWRTLCTSSL